MANRKQAVNGRLPDGDARHGTRTGYGHGCRCDGCRAAKAEYVEQRKEARAKEMADDPAHPLHGTLAGYHNRCPCQKCRTLGVEHEAARGAKRQAQVAAERLAELSANPADPRHGRRGHRLGCRCAKCQRHNSMTPEEIVFEELDADPADPRHGKTGYGYGCRCDVCRKAKAQDRESKYGAKLAYLDAHPDDAQHGLTGYGYGCRCDVCRSAWREYAGALREVWTATILADPDDPRHGSTTGWRAGCRCDKCRDVQRDGNARHVADLEADPADERHGSMTGYVYGCRCERCCEDGLRDYLRQPDVRDRASARATFRAAVVRGAPDYPADPGLSWRSLWDEGETLCHLCGEVVDPDDVLPANPGSSHETRPGPRYPSIDHLLPISRGGYHVRTNVAMSHMQCNIRRNNRLL